MYNYFPHPSNARQSSGLVSLLMEEGYEGYGLYWAIIELLRDAPSYHYTSDEKVLAYVLHAPDPGAVQRVIRNFGLFDFDEDGLLFSPWLQQQLNGYEEKKAALKEAGRRGAARRWHKSDDRANGEAIATPSNGDGEAIANNIIYNNTRQNIIQPNPTEDKEWGEILKNPGLKISDELVAHISSHEDEGYNSGYVAQVCRDYGIGQNAMYYLVNRMDGARLDHPLYQKFCALVRRIQAEKFRPKQPAAFFLSKLTE